MGTVGSRRAFLSSGMVATGAVAMGGIGFNRAASARESEGMITQTASFRLNPEKEDEAVALLRELVAAVEEKEPGVLAYIAHRTAEDSSVVTFFEVYADQAALQNHGQQPHLGKLRQAFGAGVFQPLSADSPVKIVRLDRVAGFAR